MFFKKKNPAVQVNAVSLNKDYAFMYENFIISGQRDLYLLLEQTDDVIDLLHFEFLVYKYGYPNDEVSHPLSDQGLYAYGLYEVMHSPWITELKDHNRQHHRHTDSSFQNYKHYIARFKDVTLEVICTQMDERKITKAELLKIIDAQIRHLSP